MYTAAADPLDLIQSALWQQRVSRVLEILTLELGVLLELRAPHSSRDSRGRKRAFSLGALGGGMTGGEGMSF